MKLKEAIVESIRSFYNGKPLTNIEEDQGHPVKYTFEYMDNLDSLKEDKKNGSKEKENV